MAGRKKEGPKFSQFDEEPILLKLLEELKLGPGRCADIGARERRGSNVAALIDGGWEALLIDRNVNGLLKDFPAVKYPKVIIVPWVVTAQNINQVLWKKIDVLSLDIDGPDADVWEAMDARPKIAIIEAIEENREKIVRVSKERGYTLHAETGPNLIYVL